MGGPGGRGRGPRRCAVIGAGIVGASVAARLAQAGLEVTLLDASPHLAAGEAATRSSFAWLNANEKLPRGYHELNRAGMLAWADVAASLGGGPGGAVRDRGSPGGNGIAAHRVGAGPRAGGAGPGAGGAGPGAGWPYRAPEGRLLCDQTAGRSSARRAPRIPGERSCAEAPSGCPGGGARLIAGRVTAAR